jgi:hypothetical protein
MAECLGEAPTGLDKTLGEKHDDFVVPFQFFEMESHMSSRDRINDIFDVLSLFVVRLTLLALEIIGAYTLIGGRHG